MSNANDFVIENGVLKKYTGPGGDVVIPEGVTEIGWEAFYKCSGLASITIPDSVTSIGHHTFGDCTNLTEIIIPDSITSIRSGAFKNCTRLANITIGTGVKNIDSFAFANCESLANIVISDSVTSIGENAFLETAYYKDEGNWDQGVLYIGNHLIKANFPKSVKNYIVKDGTVCIADEAFEKCNKMLAIKLPQSLQSIGSNAFRLCKKLTEIEILGSCASTGLGSFEKCTGLRSIILDEGIKEIAGGSFFGCTGLSHIEIPNSVEAVGDNAFNGCNSLEELVLPESVKTVDASSFGDCTALKRIVFSKAVMDTIDAKWFRSRFNNVDLNFIWLEENTNFDSRVGELCKKSILRKKDEYAAKIFENDAALAMKNYLVLVGNISVDLVERYIATGTEKGATAVTAMLLDYKEKHFTLQDTERAMEEKFEKELGFRKYTVADWRKIFKFTISDGKVVISAYKGNESSITIPAMIGKNKVISFTLCDYDTQKVYKEEVQNKLTNVVIEDGVEIIGEDAFLNCTALQTISIPKSVTTIGCSAFFQCTNLKNIEIPSGVTTIGSSAFNGCKSLTSMILPNGMISIDQSLFCGCENLTEIVIPDGVTAIQYSAFCGCINLNKIVIPTGVEHIESDAFHNTGYYNDPANWNGVFLYIGDRLIAVNKNCGLENHAIQDGTRYIASRAFSHCNLKEIVIPDSVTDIDGFAFGDCKNLISVIIPNSVTSIRAGTFQGCTSLTHIVLPDSITNIEAWAFQDCCNLTSIVIPNSVIHMDKLAFLRCTKVVIHAPAGSYAETYAKENNIPFVAE